jgi:DNA adenine methylase
MGKDGKSCLTRCVHLLDHVIEPFMGSGVVFMNTNYSSYVLADTQPDLVSLLQIIQDEGVFFIDYCEELFCQENNTEEQYYRLRGLFNECTDKRLKAALFLYLNRHGYNGLCRFNSTGRYNVPFGDFKRPYFPRKELLLFHQKSQSVSVAQSDFRKTFAMAKPGDVIYCDPPYAPIITRQCFYYLYWCGI